MTDHRTMTIAGRITDVFAHRFVVATTDGRRILADLGPKGADAFPLEEGVDIVASGEMKPSELKVAAIGPKGGAQTTIEHKKKDDHGDGRPGDAKSAVQSAGLSPLGEPRRKPKHFEVLARKGAVLVECHVEFDGTIRKEKPVEGTDEKWADAIASAA